MTKRDLVVRISNETGLIQQQVLDVVQKTLDYIAEAVAEGKNVELRNFGVFEVRHRPARKARNPQTGEEIRLDARRVLDGIQPERREHPVRTEVLDPAAEAVDDGHRALEWHVNEQAVVVFRVEHLPRLTRLNAYLPWDSLGKSAAPAVGRAR